MDGLDEDHHALAAACQQGAGLCTLVGIEGSFSRRLGAQLAVLPDGSTVGDLADSCLERQLASDIAAATGPVVIRYGRGSPKIDFRLPCGGGLDILLDPAPDRAACTAAVERLRARQPVTLALPGDTSLTERPYIPALHLRVFGEGSEAPLLCDLAASLGVTAECIGKDALALGQPSGLPPADPWTAVLLLFHDHEWELALLAEALAQDAFYIGAQGGVQARETRMDQLTAMGLGDAASARLCSPVGLLPACRTPRALALSILTEIIGAYEQLRATA